MIRIPDPGDLASLRDLIDGLEPHDEVVLVLEAVPVRTEPILDTAPSVVPKVLPPGLGLDGIDGVNHGGTQLGGTISAMGTGVWSFTRPDAGSGAFTEHDLTRVLQEFDGRDGALDYSRYDLNGSGHTGGPSTQRFDLDMSGSHGASPRPPAASP